MKVCVGECPNCDAFETNHNYHCKRCNMGFESQNEAGKHWRVCEKR